MRRRGYLLRFIDLGLIILFGFLMISDITVISQVTLPGKSDEPADPAEEDNKMFLGVSIQEDGSYQVLSLENKEPLHVGINSQEELEFVLKTLKDQQSTAGKELNILIEPAPASKMQRLINVLDACDEVKIPKNINTEIVLTGSTSG